MNFASGHGPTGGESRASTSTIHDRPLMLSDLFLIIGIASEAAREQGVAFEEMLSAVVMDELQLDWTRSPK